MLARRTFLQSASAVVLGSGLTLPCRGYALPWLTLSRYVGAFAAAIGADIVADRISRYLSSRRSSTTEAQSIQRANQQMERSGFTDFSQSAVHRRRRTRDEGQGQLFYPVFATNGLDVCVPYFDNGANITMMEGPSVVGLGLFAQELAGDIGVEGTNAIVYPRELISRDDGSFRRSYGQRDRYRSDVATIDIDYNNIRQDMHSGSGRVRVTAVRSLDGSPIRAREYDISYEV